MLTVAAVPIGNSQDASEHLRTTLQNARYVIAEDSRKFHRLCSDLKVQTNAKIYSFFDGNESETIEELTKLIKAHDVVLVSDAGTPGINDPGYRLIRAAINNDVPFQVLPGPSAVFTALLLSGLATDRFCFEGFPPRTQAARQKWFADLASEERTIIFFEAPHRIMESLSDAQISFGSDRLGAICREMTKQYEQTIRGKLSDLVEWANNNEVLGEITVVLAGFDPKSAQIDTAEIIARVKAGESAGLTRKSAISVVAKDLTLPKRLVYELMIDQ